MVQTKMDLDEKPGAFLKMEISISNLQKKIPLQTDQIKKVVQRILKFKRLDQACISVVFVSSQKIRALNKKYLNRTYATDVLAFNLSDENCNSSTPDGEGEDLMGDIVISTDAVRQNVKKFKTEPAYELVLYVVHGILHLLGYDDHSAKDTREMRAEEQVIMNYLGQSIHQTILES